MAYGTWRLNAAFTKGSPIITILNRINPIPLLMSISLRLILILSSHLCLRLGKVSFLQVYLLKFWKHSYLFHSGYMTCPSQSSRLNHPDYVRWTVQTMFLIVGASPLFASLLGPKIRLRILFSNTPSLRSYLNVRNHASQPYNTTDNIIILYILIFKFLERRREDKVFELNNNMNFLYILNTNIKLFSD